MSWLTRGIVLAAVVVPLTPAAADSVRLVNGDLISGQVISLDDKQLKLKSDALGELTIPRSKIVAIFLGDAPQPLQPSAAAARPKSDAAQSTADAVAEQLKAEGVDVDKTKRLLEQLTGSESTEPKPSPQAAGAEDALQQIREGKVDRETIKQLEQRIPLLSLPGVRDYFHQTLSGLQSGQLDLQDLRRDAIKARDGLLDIKKDLGPSGQALDGYLRILNKFIDETAPAGSTVGSDKPPTKND